MSFNTNFICDHKAQQVLTLSKEILGQSLLEIQIVAIKLSENFEENSASIAVKLVELCEGKTKKKSIGGEGVGLVDACFDALIKAYNEQYCSLDDISIVDFGVNTNFDQASRRKSDAKACAILRVKNSDDFEYAFQYTTTSISHSSVSAAKEAIAFFINAELAYTRLYVAFKDAQARGRNDLIERYQNQMSTLVHATSYEKLVDKLRA